MKNINLNSKAEVRNLGNAIEAALQALGKEYGLKIRYNGGTLLGSTECKLKVHIEKINKSSAEVNEVKELMKSYDVDFFFNKQFTCRGKRKGTTETFIVTGFNPRCYSNPFILERPNGGPTAKCNEDFLRAHIPGAPPKKIGTLTMVDPPSHTRSDY